MAATAPFSNACPKYVYDVQCWGATPGPRSYGSPDCSAVLKAIFADMIARAGSDPLENARGYEIHFPAPADPTHGYRFSRPLRVPVSCVITGESRAVGQRPVVTLWFDEGIAGVVFLAGGEASNIWGTSGGQYTEVRNIRISPLKDACPGQWWPDTTGYSNYVHDSYYRFIVPLSYNGFMYECTAIAGGKNPSTATTGSTEPLWPTEKGKSVDDGDYTWTCRTMTSHGFWARCQVSLIGCSATGFLGDGYRVESPDPADLWYCERCWFDANLGSGLHATDHDANGGSAYHCSFKSNGRYGLDDQGRHANSFFSCHFTKNGAIRWSANRQVEAHEALMPLGGYNGYRYYALKQGVTDGNEPDPWPTTPGMIFPHGTLMLLCVAAGDDTQPAGSFGTCRTISGTFTGCYTKPDYAPIDLGQFGIWIGGSSLTSFDDRPNHEGWSIELGGQQTKPFMVTNVQPQPLQTRRMYTTIGHRDGTDALSFGATDEKDGYGITYGMLPGWFSFVAGRSGYGIALSLSGSNADVGLGQVFFNNGFYLGGVSGYYRTKHVTGKYEYPKGDPSPWSKWAQGDLCWNMEVGEGQAVAWRVETPGDDPVWVDLFRYIASPAVTWSGPDPSGRALAKVDNTRDRNDTTDGTAGVVIHSFTPADGELVRVLVEVLAKRTDVGGDAANFLLRATFLRQGASLTVVGSPEVMLGAPTDVSHSTAGATSWRAVIASNGPVVEVRATGEAGKRIHWSVVRQSIETV